MKHILPLFIPLLLIGLVCCGKAARPPVEQQSELAMRIGSALPQNWSLEESNGQIMISRKEPITSYGCIGLDLSWTKHPELLQKDVERNGVAEDYKIRLRLAPKVSLVEYAQLKNSNSQITVTKRTGIQSREFYEDSAMQSFDPRYRELPEYYDKDSSVYVETTLHPWECIYPGDVARECEKVRQALDSFLTRYPEAESRRGLSWMDL
jgi:hypothetical protein